jgi:CubicO group peptidase (beta-lactamase class C family)
MPGGSRSLPDQPNLRYLRLEAKRRLAAGEFPTLHDAQAGIAREHGEPSWASLKQLVCDPANQESHALDQLRWVISRFSGAQEPDWTAPADDELRQHFSEHFLTVLPPDALVAEIRKLAADLRGDPVVIRQAPLQAQVELAGLRYLAAVEAEPPYRLSGLRGLPLGSRVRDPRVTDPASAPVATQGDVPPEAPAIADEAFAELGLAALLIAGADPEARQSWVLAKGWADLDRGETLDPGHRFPAPGVTFLATATAVLRLVADGRLALDRPANDYLRTVRLADDSITVRELLSHTAGVDNPTVECGDAVPDLVTLTGPVVACPGPRGELRPSNGGCAVLGQLIADVTAAPYADAVTGLVLAPLGLRDSSFPAGPAGIGPGAVTGYNLTLRGGTFAPVPAKIPNLQAAAGLWSTGADLVRLGLGWSSLLPESLAHEALTPQAEPAPGGYQAGLGWLLSPRGDTAMHAGGGYDATAYLTVRIRDNRTLVVLTSRMIPVNTVADRLLRSWT